MSVSEFTGLKLEQKGKTYYFCGEACRNRFIAAEAAKVPASA